MAAGGNEETKETPLPPSEKRLERKGGRDRQSGELWREKAGPPDNYLFLNLSF